MDIITADITRIITILIHLITGVLTGIQQVSIWQRCLLQQF